MILDFFLQHVTNEIKKHNEIVGTISIFLKVKSRTIKVTILIK